VLKYTFSLCVIYNNYKLELKVKKPAKKNNAGLGF